jgi:hypothetical protein
MRGMDDLPNELVVDLLWLLVLQNGALKGRSAECNQTGEQAVPSGSGLDRDGGTAQIAARLMEHHLGKDEAHKVHQRVMLATLGKLERE